MVCGCLIVPKYSHTVTQQPLQKIILRKTCRITRKLKYVHYLQSTACR